MLAGMGGVGRPQHRCILRETKRALWHFCFVRKISWMIPVLGGTHQPDEADILPVTRLIIVFVMLGSFALIFAELVRQSEELSIRPQPTASRCGDAAGTPCPQKAL
ncbi:hypothetical protein [Mesorhizobium sp. B2-1-3A]|uniref:hypothetical protein n=1 Tax=Mesorhizobium sp. B2-1-3A TaxID=2589971 RepID=UPI001FEF5AB5|nr:hypothetical protein [Mesorhizobium sp. B2-1-3A]